MQDFYNGGSFISESTDDISHFFAQLKHSKPEVLKRLLSDISTLCLSQNFSRRCTTWGATQQPKVCIYGGLPINLKVSSASSSNNNQKHVGEMTHIVLPIQLWLTQQYPVDPPIVFVLSNEAGCKIASNHKYIDVTGRCHVPELAAWQPTSSSLCVLVESIGNMIENEGLSPLRIDSEGVLSPCDNRRSSLTRSTNSYELKKDLCESTVDAVNKSEEGSNCVVCLGPKDTVLVPCGHYCVCSACAANLLKCPICRDPVKFRQRVFA